MDDNVEKFSLRVGRKDRHAPAFVLPGEDKPRRLGEDPDMPPTAGLRSYERPVNLGFAHLKGTRR